VRCTLLNPIQEITSIEADYDGIFKMRLSLRTKAIAICNEKIAKKGDSVGLSFYAFFANKNDDPELLMEAAEWWIKTHELDHFEKALKIRNLIRAGV
jgi:hypothetical protein